MLPEELLFRCIAAVEDGENPTRVAAHYPEYSAELDPLLKTVLILRGTSKPQMSGVGFVMGRRAVAVKATRYAALHKVKSARTPVTPPVTPPVTQAIHKQSALPRRGLRRRVRLPVEPYVPKQPDVPPESAAASLLPAPEIPIQSLVTPALFPTSTSSPSTSSHRRGFFWPALYSGVAVAAVVLIVVTVAVGNGGSLPGDPLYTLKRTAESLQRVILSTTDNEANWYADQVVRRLGEALAIAAQGETVDQALMAEIVENTNAALMAVNDLPTSERARFLLQWQQDLERLNAQAVAGSPTAQTLAQTMMAVTTALNAVRTLPTVLPLLPTATLTPTPLTPTPPTPTSSPVPPTTIATPIATDVAATVVGATTATTQPSTPPPSATPVVAEVVITPTNTLVVAQPATESATATSLPTSTPVPELTASAPTPTPTPTPTSTSTAIPANGPTNAPTPTWTLQPTATVLPPSTPAPEATATPLPIATSTPTVEPTATETATATATEIATETATAIPTEEPTPTPQEPTVEPTAEATVTPTEEATVESSAEATSEPTAGPTIEPTIEPTVEPTATLTPTPSVEPTATAQVTVEPTPEPTVSATTEATVEATPEVTTTPTTELPEATDDPIDEGENEGETSNGDTATGDPNPDSDATAEPESPADEQTAADEQITPDEEATLSQDGTDQADEEAATDVADLSASGQMTITPLVKTPSGDESTAEEGDEGEKSTTNEQEDHAPSPNKDLEATPAPTTQSARAQNHTVIPIHTPTLTPTVTTPTVASTESSASLLPTVTPTPVPQPTAIPPTAQPQGSAIETFVPEEKQGGSPVITLTSTV